MSIAAGTEIETSLDFSALEDEMPARACEHRHHAEDIEYHADGNEHYVLAKPVCPCHKAASVVIRCQKFLEETAKVGLHCPLCYATYYFWDRYEDLGLVEGRAA